MIKSVTGMASLNVPAFGGSICSIVLMVMVYWHF